MNYEEFINSIKESRENRYFENSECHHIIPRCIGGTDDEENLIYLTYREHFIAHKLLAEENLDDKRLVLAYWRMCNGKHKIATPEEYEEARLEFSDAIRELQTGETNSFYGRHHTDESKRKMAEPQLGKEFTSDHKKKISESLKGNKNVLGKTWTVSTRKYHLICKRCGEDFTGKSGNRYYCDKCEEVLS